MADERKREKIRDDAAGDCLDHRLGCFRETGNDQGLETLYDGSHPLRLALKKLQTLDVVRIIEGKA